MSQDSYSPTRQTWIGPASEVTRCLNEVHADLDAADKFCLDIPGGDMSFLNSDQELVVTDAMAYFSGGRKMSLYSLMLGRGHASEPKIVYGEGK